MNATIITAIKPSGTPHLGNYVGAIAPTLELAAASSDQIVVFVADGHALNTIRSPRTLRENTDDIVATYLACGLDPGRTLIFRQSDVPEIFELASVLACVCPKGTANRAHAYKTLVERNLDRRDDPDAGVNMGLFGYPVLMAADILSVGASVVPVGPDQLQHLEVARELARRFNHHYGPVFEEPLPRLSAPECIPGTDGRKMSKSYDNTIDVFAPAKAVRKQVSRIRTSSRAVGEPGDPSSNVVLALIGALAEPGVANAARERLIAGAGDGELKRVLSDTLERRFSLGRERYRALLADRTRIHAVLRDGAEEARGLCRATLARVKAAVGFDGSV